jgi:hypothetical protein
MLPATASPATTRTSSTKTTEPTTTTKSTTTAEPAPSKASTASPKNLGKQEPEKQAAQRSYQDDQYNDNKQDDPADRDTTTRCALRWSWRARLVARELDSRILGDDLGNAAGDQQQSLVVAIALHQREGLPLKTAYLSIRQNRFQPITDFNSRTVILDGVEDQNSPVCGLAADPPSLEEIDGISFDVGAIEGIDGDQGDLGVGVCVNLPADIVDLRSGGGIKNVREIVDVARRVELRNRFWPGPCVQRQKQHRRQTRSRTQIHTQIVQDASQGLCP